MVYEGAEAQIPHLSGGQIEQEASTFLKENWGGDFPVDVEAICDQLGVGVVYVPGIYRNFGVDSYINSDFTTIVVDEDAAVNNEARYRFSIAHELGHLVLHKEYYPSNIYDLESFLRYITIDRNSDAEHQADMFAAALLVPLDELKTQMEEVFGRDLRVGFEDVSEETRSFAYSAIVDYFQVSDAVLAKRISKLLK